MVLAISSQWAEDGDADKMPTEHRAAPTVRSLLCPLAQYCWAGELWP